MRKKLQRRQKNSIRSAIFFRCVIFILTGVALVTIALYDKDMMGGRHMDYQEGDPAEKDIYSPFNFTYINEWETNLKRLYEKEKVEDIYRKDSTYALESINYLNTLFAPHEKPAEGEVADLTPLYDALPMLDRNTIRTVVENGDKAFEKDARESIAQYFDKGLMSLSQKIDLFKNGEKSITVADNNVFRSVPVSAIHTISEEVAAIEKNAFSQYPDDKKKRLAFVDVVKMLLKPNLVFDADVTGKRKQEVYEQTQSVYDKVVKGEIVLRKGQLISNNDLLKLTEIEKMRAQREVVLYGVGLGIIVLVTLVLLFVTLHVFERKVFLVPKNLLAICVVVVAVFALSKGLMQLPGMLPIAPLAPILVAILFSMRVGILVAVVEALLVGTITEFNSLFFVMGIVAGIMALYATIGLRRRSQFFKISLYVAVMNFCVAFGYYVFAGDTVYESFRTAVSSLLNGLLVWPFLLIGTYAFERMFDITTDITLLELSDLNHPLLRRLVIEAPGTYHHSLVVSNLAENACEAIGANSLLARVGCYYHDIGKIEKAEYFTENQSSQEQNIHDTLDASMSCMFIINHVKDGLALGQKYNLKKVILDFIVQHHGKSVVYYFYKKAMTTLEHEKNKDEEEVNIDDFRYPGPKPQTREIAVAMLADSVEAASRSLAVQDQDALTDLVSKVINDKFMDNQMDASDLTLSDLKKIQASFVRNLMAIFHTRVKYPEKE